MAMGGRQKQANVRLDDEALALIDRAAKKAVRTRSDWVRIALLDRARAEIGGAPPILPPDDEEAITLAALREIEADGPELLDSLLSLGRSATRKPPLARAVKELAEAVRDVGPGGSAGPARRGQPRE